VRSPLLDVARSCQPCHNVREGELEERVHIIQDRTQALIERSASALVDLVAAIATAQQQGVGDDALAEALQRQRSAQWRIDFVYSEGSHGFHAPQETARILAEAIDYARQGEAAAFRTFTPPVIPEALPVPQVEGVTPDEEAPAGRPQVAPPPPR
jgi:nitrite reductase (cytochrome c-552)